MSWDIIGWIILAVIAITIVWTLVTYVAHRILFATTTPPEPEKYDIWISSGGERHYITNVVRVRDNQLHPMSAPIIQSIVVSVVAGNNGGTHFSLDEWNKLVKRKRLLRYVH